MKKLLVFLFLVGFLFSCSKDNEIPNVVNPELFGKWKLIATFQDPGDGSGVFESIESEKTIEFFDNGTFSMNGPLCSLSTVVGENITGNVNSSDNSPDNILNANQDCEWDNDVNEYRVRIEGSDLVIYWTACVEGCAQKYQKLSPE